MKQNIAISSNSSWTIFNFRLELAKYLITKEYKVYLISTKDEYSEKLERQGFEFYPLKIQGQGKNPFKDFSLIQQFKRVYKEQKIDIALHFTIKPVIYGSIAAKSLNIPVINNIAGLGNIFTGKSFLTIIVKWLYRYSQRNIAFIFFQNTDDIQLFKKLKILNHSRYSRLPGSGVDILRFRSLNKNINRPLAFLLFGRMLWDKGVGEYVKASELLKKEFPNVRFLLLGLLDFENPSAISTWQMNEWMKQRNVEYLGTTDKVEDEISKSDCVVLPSYYREGVPRSLLEAGAMGKPLIIAKNVGSNDVVVDKWNGFVVEPRSVEELTAAMKKMILMKKEDREAMGENSAKKIKNEFDENIVLKAYYNQIQKIFND